MKNIIIRIFQAALLALLSSGLLLAADPTVNGAAVNPSPITVSTGISVSFNTANIGTATSSPSVAITVSLLKLAPSQTFNLSTDISGTGSSRFTWTYDQLDNVLTGVLNSNWAQNTGGEVVISNLVLTGTSVLGSEANGLNVNVVAPSAVNVNQNNDETSAFTYSLVALPVQLTNFNVVKEGKVAHLFWKTVAESNSAFFEVQHSLDARNWKALGKVKSTGESALLTNYGFIHTSPVSGANYYRLKMVDTDDTFSYSGIRVISFENLVTTRLYPNPAASVLTIDTGEWNKVASVELISTMGVRVYQSGAPINNIDVKNLSDGIYILKLLKTDGGVDKFKVVVAR